MVAASLYCVSFLQWDDELVHAKSSAGPASDYDGRVLKAASPVKSRYHWTGDTSLGVGSNPTFPSLYYDLNNNLA